MLYPKTKQQQALTRLVDSSRNSEGSSKATATPRAQSYSSARLLSRIQVHCLHTDEQLQRLELYVSNWKNTHFMATEWMRLPFFTYEVKCGNEALNSTDRQNAHSASVAVKGIVELYRVVSRQNELHRNTLAFSISHDHEVVRIYGHYPLIDRVNRARKVVRHDYPAPRRMVHPPVPHGITPSSLSIPLPDP